MKAILVQLQRCFGILIAILFVLTLEIGISLIGIQMNGLFQIEMTYSFQHQVILDLCPEKERIITFSKFSNNRREYRAPNLMIC